MRILRYLYTGFFVGKYFRPDVKGSTTSVVQGIIGLNGAFCLILFGIFIQFEQTRKLIDPIFDNKRYCEVIAIFLVLVFIQYFILRRRKVYKRFMGHTIGMTREELQKLRMVNVWIWVCIFGLILTSVLIRAELNSP